MTTAPVRPVSPPGDQLTTRTAPRPRPGMAEVTPSGEIDGLATLVDRLPQPADAIDHGVMPLLRHVDQLGPDLNQLLASVSQLSHMASRLPKVFRRHSHPEP